MDRVLKIRAEIERLLNHVKDSNFDSDSGAFYYLKDLLDFIDSLQEEPVKIKKGCKYRCLSDMVNRDTGNISFIEDKIYLAPKDNTLVSEEDGDLCDTSEDASNFELVEEPKKCMYSKDDYTDEDRKVLCDGCEEECKYAQKEEPVSEGLIEELKKIVNIRECVSQGVPVIKIAKHFAQWQKEQLLAKAFDFTKEHNTACVLASECLRNHGWFNRERDFNDLFRHLSCVDKLFEGKFSGKTKVIVIKED